MKNQIRKEQSPGKFPHKERRADWDGRGAYFTGPRDPSRLRAHVFTVEELATIASASTPTLDAEIV